MSHYRKDITLRLISANNSSGIMHICWGTTLRVSSMNNPRIIDASKRQTFRFLSLAVWLHHSWISCFFLVQRQLCAIENANYRRSWGGAHVVAISCSLPSVPLYLITETNAITVLVRTSCSGALAWNAFNRSFRREIFANHWAGFQLLCHAVWHGLVYCIQPLANL